ncbi:MAG: hypothetical protein HXX17_04870 [Geobacteraceae bacterium]|nr:hypothetical protein [Geobacteraceae bacterium]
MLKYMLIILSITILSGCSELKVIGGAAMRELRAEGMNVEKISYNYQARLESREKAGLVTMAKADVPRFTTYGRMVGEDKKIKLAKNKRVKGLWEKNSI